MPSDWYLRLTGEATKMLRNQIGLTTTIPISPGDTGGPVNHIHTVWRDIERDYGGDLLRKHYLENAHHKPAISESNR